MRDDMWLKRVLIPFWVVDLIWFIVLFGLSARDLYVLDDVDDGNLYARAIDIAAAILLAMSAISIIFDITIIILFAKHKLTPVAYIVLQCIKTVFWTIIFILDLIAASRHERVGLTFLFSAVLAGASVGQLVYGSVILDRKRKGKLPHRGQYTGVESGHLAPGYESPPRGSYAAYNPHGVAPSNPFRDPSPARAASPVPSATAAQQPAVMHPAFRPNSGAANEYYDASSIQQSYEMQGTAYKDH